MTTISPTRVSMYDFLYQDFQPMVSLLADTAKLSLPQTRLALSSSLQAIVSALLAYQQRYQGQAVNKKLFSRSAVKEMRQYNSMNFATINATLYHRHDVADAVFNDSARVIKASEHIAAQIDASTSQVQILLTCLCVIVLRELAILADYSQLNNDELDKWFALQPQFLSIERFASVKPIKTSVTLAGIDHNSVNNTIHTNKDGNSEENINQQSGDKENLISTEVERINTETRYLLISEPPPFDPYWDELTAFKPVNNAPVQDMLQATANYIKVIGRSPENIQQGKHNDLLMFAQMSAIALPHQRWLLQLAKVSDIYLHRNRLRITSEPTTPPTPPSTNLGITGSSSDKKPTSTSKTPAKHDKPVPLWKNPIILIIIMVIGSLSALASLKYQKQKSDGLVSATEAVLEQDHAKQRELAIDKADNNKGSMDVERTSAKADE